MIKPSVGRIVLYRAAGSDPAADPHAALVVGVIDDRTVNLAIFNADGAHYQGTAVPLLQDDDKPPEGVGYAEWMVYQKGQANKAEAAEGAVAKQVTDLALDVDAKFKSLGDWLTPALEALGKRIDAVTTPPAAPPADPAQADVAGAGAAPQGQA